MSGLETRLLRLGAELRRHEPFWRPSVFHDARPAWRAKHAALAQSVLALDDDRCDHLASDNIALGAWAIELIPDWRTCIELSHLPGPDAAVPVDRGRASWHTPGRKQAQIEAFAAATGAPIAPLLEWCAGKGHLGRHYARRWGSPVASLDHDAGLCRGGADLAHRSGIAQAFIVADALAPSSAEHLAGRHAVALHACGDLHHTLLRGAVGRARAIDLSPCCYYRTSSPRYRPFNPEADLPLSRDELHLPVTETAATAGERARRLRDQAMARKLGYLAWYADHVGTPRPPGLKPVPSAWNGLIFEEYALRMAARDGLTPTTGTDWAGYMEIGAVRRREVMRLNLVRMAFRRPLEVWLALDQAVFLERAGYHARLSEFCAASLTPRNILVSARR